MIVTSPRSSHMMLNSLKSQCTKPHCAKRASCVTHCAYTLPGSERRYFRVNGAPSTRLINTACRLTSTATGTGNPFSPSAFMNACSFSAARRLK